MGPLQRTVSALTASRHATNAAQLSTSAHRALKIFTCTRTRVLATARQIQHYWGLLAYQSSTAHLRTATLFSSVVHQNSATHLRIAIL